MMKVRLNHLPNLTMFFIGIFILSMKLSMLNQKVVGILRTISLRYEGSDIAPGPYIPHLNFDYGVKNTVNTVDPEKSTFRNTFFRYPK
jgi:hypothetical protein